MAVGPWQLVIIAVVVLMFFGATRLSEVGKGLGEGIRSFKKGIEGDEDEDSDDEAEPKQLGPKKKKLPPVTEDGVPARRKVSPKLERAEAEDKKLEASGSETEEPTADAKDERDAEDDEDDENDEDDEERS